MSEPPDVSIESVLAEGLVHSVFQPIVELSSGAAFAKALGIPAVRIP